MLFEIECMNKKCLKTLLKLFHNVVILLLFSLSEYVFYLQNYMIYSE